MRTLYTLLATLALPFASLVVLWRGLRERAYWRGWSARFGGGAALAGSAPSLWVHAVSVGEVQAAASLVAALRAAWPALSLVVTSATPAGRERAREAFGADADVRYAPYDLPWTLRAALRRLRPALLVVMETELWPNLFHECTRAGVPVLIASARLSARSAARWARFRGLLQPALDTAVTVAAQSAADAGRFASLGVPATRIHVCGNIKFDRTSGAAVRARAQQLRTRYAAARPMWVAGSTHPGEERAALEAHAALRATRGDALLVLAPRHSPRFGEVATTLAASGLSWLRRSAAGGGIAAAGVGRAVGVADSAPPASAAVLLLDTIGELEDFYAAADVAFVGGSLVPIGGHNLLEPAALGVATLTGPYQHNAPDIARLLGEAGGLQFVGNAAELGAALVRLMADEAARSRMATAAQATVAANRGALAKVLALVSDLLASPPRPLP
jgi:3-deoxy-D-manno-octulosonic-acid transferase